MRRVNDDFIKKFLNIPSQKLEEEKKLERQKRLQDYNAKSKNSSFISEDDKKYISSSMDKIFENIKHKTSIEKSKSQESWSQHITPYGIFYHNKEKNIWQNSFGKIANSVEELIDFSSLVDVPETYKKRKTEIQYNVTSSYIDLDMSNTYLDLTIPIIQSAGINPGLVLYETPFLSALGNTYDPSINQNDYTSILEIQLNNWSTKNQTYSYFNEYPKHVMLDFEHIITNYINVWNLDGITAMNKLINTLKETKKTIPNAVVYEYNTPLIQFYPGGYEINSFGGVGYTFDKTIQQYADKINYIKNDSDLIDLSAYCPFYENPSDYNNGSGPGKLTLFSYWNNLVYPLLNSNAGANKQKQVTISFVVYPGADISIPYPTSLADAENLGNLILSNDFIDQNIFIPAKQAGITNMFIWEAWPYRITVAKSASPTAESYLYRKTMNDLFLDLNPSDTTYSLTDAWWTTTQAEQKMYYSTAVKTAQLATLFKQIT